MKKGDEAMELKKSYKGFLLWMLVWLIVMFVIVFVPGVDGVFATRWVMNVCTIGMAILCYIMYKTEHVYWMNGTTYEQAVKAGSERRKEFALKHLKVFGYFAVVYLAVTLIFHVLNISFWIDMVIGTVGIIICAVRTVPFKL